MVKINVNVNVIEDHRIKMDDIPKYDKIILSPGPGKPIDKQSLNLLLKEFGHRKPMLGVCLGMQGIGEFYGAKLVNLTKVNHGVSANICQTKQSDLFTGLPKVFKAGLYHSWALELTSESRLLPLAYSEDGVLMAISHENYPLYGVQFHPESILTENGIQILSNFIKM